MKKILLLAFVSSCCLPVFSQKMLLLEKAHSARTKKFFIGDELTFRLRDKDLDFWQMAVITDIFPEEKSIGLNGRKIALADVEQLRVQRSRFFRAFGTQMMVFGGSYLVFGGVAAWRDDEPVTRTTAFISAGTFAGGWAMRRFLRFKKINLAEKRRLRAIEIPVFKP